jgi:signal transduction histidine kinase/CheY-like chemotaxis protein
MWQIINYISKVSRQWLIGGALHFRKLVGAFGSSKLVDRRIAQESQSELESVNTKIIPGECVPHRSRLGLRMRVLLSLLLAASTFGWAAWEVMNRSIRSRFATLENYHAIENANRAKNLLAERATQLAGHASDWGAWDDTYAFISDLNEEYVSSNLTSDGIARLNVNCILFLDTMGKVKASVGFDFETNEVARVPDAVLQHDWLRFSLAEAELNKKLSGVVIVDKTPYLMGASPILTSEGAGPIHGTIVELRKIDDRELTSLSSSLRFPFSVSSRSLATHEQVHCDFINDQAMTVCFGMNELIGDKAIHCICTLDRRIMAEGNRALADALTIVLITGALLSALMYFVIGRLVIARVCKMTEEIYSLDVNSGRFQVNDRGNDEIGNLAKQFNSLIKTMLASQCELCNSNVELARTMQDAESANRSKSAFLANMSHEIRTPLTAILGYTEILREGNQERRIETIDTIQRAGQHLLTVINDILDLSKIEADRMTLESIPTSIPEILREVTNLMTPRANENRLRLGLELASAIPESIAVDPTRLRQIIMNLVGNAIKFTEQGSVVVRCGLDSSTGKNILFFDVEDTGIGLSPRQAAELFQPFRQADETVTRQHGGTGLGLTICRRLAKLMGGNVQLTKSEPGVGSCFRLTLPTKGADLSKMVHTLDALNTVEPKPAPAASRLEGRILLAEDGPDNQKLISLLLRKAGAQVDVAENGLVALSMIEQAAESGIQYDLLLTDMQMPVMDGYTLASTVKKRKIAISIVALTAHAMAEDRDKCIAAGCDDYATKPIDKASLLATCGQWIGKGGRSEPKPTTQNVTVEMNTTMVAGNLVP